MTNIFDDENLSPVEQEPEQEYSQEEIQDEILDEDQVPATDVDEHINEAMMRIEQAQLYKILITHSLFGEGSARPEIQAAVEQEIREFATSRLEILVGVRSESGPKIIAADPQFEPEEVNFIKSLYQRAQQKAMAQPNPQINPVAVAPQVIAPAPVPAIRPVQVARAKPVANRVQPVKAQAKKPVSRPAARSQAAPTSPKVAKRPPTANIGAHSGKDYGQAGNPKAAPVPHPLVVANKAASEAARNSGGMGAVFNAAGGTAGFGVPGLDAKSISALTTIYSRQNAGSED